MKTAVKTCKEIIKENFEFWKCEPFHPRVLDNIRTTGINNYGVISVMYAENYITFREFKLLDRYNERLQSVYLYQQH